MINNKLLLLKTLCFQMVCNAVKGFPGGAGGKDSACQCKKHKRRGFHPWVGKISWRRAWQPTPVFWPGESHGQTSLAGYSPWGRKELGITEPPTHAVPSWTVLICFPHFLTHILLKAPAASPLLPAAPWLTCPNPKHVSPATRKAHIVMSLDVF